MIIIRSMPEAGWVPVSNAAARDRRISWRARGLLLELLSYPDGWETNIDKLVAKARTEGSVTEGRAAMRTAMAELVDAGYVRYLRSRDENRHWRTAIEVGDDPDRPVTDVPENRPSEDRPVEDPERRGSGLSEGRYGSKKTDTETVTKTVRNNETEDSLRLASLAAAADAAARDELNQKLYKVINGKSPNERHRALLLVERRRPSIYGQCRRSAINQIKKDEPALLDRPNGAIEIDRLSLQYVSKHYVDQTGKLPQWLARVVT